MNLNKNVIDNSPKEGTINAKIIAAFYDLDWMNFSIFWRWQILKKQLIKKIILLSLKK